MARQIYPFTYTLRDEGKDVCKYGKGTVSEKSEAALIKYLKRRGYTWHSADIEWHPTEADALEAERAADDEFIRRHGRLPLGSSRRGGAGRRVEKQCRQTCNNGNRCRNRALPGNYGFCGHHR